MLRLTILCLGLLGLAVSAMAQVPPVQQPTRTISVSATAERMVAPDLATIVLAVETREATVSRAVQRNNEAATRVMDAIRNLNVPNLTMRTLGFDVEPVYEQPPAQPRPTTTPPRIIGYRVTNRIEVRVPDADAMRLSTNVGRVLDAALAAGANRVDQVQFTLDNEAPVMRELLAEAIREAREMAAAMAAAAGVTLGPPLNLSASPYYQPPPGPFFARAAGEAAQSVPIVAGQVTVRATVSAVYEIRVP